MPFVFQICKKRNVLRIQEKLVVWELLKIFANYQYNQTVPKRRFFCNNAFLYFVTFVRLGRLKLVIKCTRVYYVRLLHYIYSRCLLVLCIVELLSHWLIHNTSLYAYTYFISDLRYHLRYQVVCIMIQCNWK